MESQNPCESYGAFEEEINDERCKELLTLLQEHIGETVSSTVWAYLWLADIENLEAWLKNFIQDAVPYSAWRSLRSFETEHRIIAKCIVETLLMLRLNLLIEGEGTQKDREDAVSRKPSAALSRPPTPGSSRKRSSGKRKADEMESSSEYSPDAHELVSHKARLLAPNNFHHNLSRLQLTAHSAKTETRANAS